MKLFNKVLAGMAAVAAVVGFNGCCNTACEKPEVVQAIELNMPKAPGEVAIKLTELKSGKVLYAENAEQVMPSASTIKVLIMAELMRRVEAGELDLNERIEISEDEKLLDSILGCLQQSDYSLYDVMVMMIIESDNTATNVLIELAGMDNVNALGGQIGLKNTRLQRKMLDFEAAKLGRQNWSSAADMDKLLGMIGRDELVSPEACKVMIDILNMQKDIESFKRYMPEDLLVAHKSGSLGNLEHETGIFWVDGNEYVLTIFTQNCTSNSDARDFIGKMSLDIFNAMGGKF